MNRNRKTTSLQQLFPEDYTYEAQDKPLDDNEEYLRFRTVSIGLCWLKLTIHTKKIIYKIK